MDNNKLETISNLFEEKEIRSAWDSEKVSLKENIKGITLIALIITIVVLLILVRSKHCNDCR